MVNIRVQEHYNRLLVTGLQLTFHGQRGNFSLQPWRGESVRKPQVQFVSVVQQTSSVRVINPHDCNDIG
jgi:hypothetical protein